MTAPDPMERAAQDWFRKGTEALQKENFKYAVECFGTSAKMKPDNVLYRQTRHGSIERMYGNNGSGAKMASVRVMGIKGRIKKGRMKKDWPAVDQAAEEGIFMNPWDAQMFAEIGEAAVEREYWEVAKYAWSKAVKYDIKNDAYNRALGMVLRELGEYMPARECFRRIYEANPTDAEARSMMSQLDAESVMDRGGYERADSTRDVASQPEAKTNAYEQDRQARKGKKRKPKHRANHAKRICVMPFEKNQTTLITTFALRTTIGRNANWLNRSTTTSRLLRRLPTIQMFWS